ncbi:hypothetical protein Y1Q_0022630 [Alligator mississippiensis]|uniref:Uncharacterized protein n=1 Tax=Alligator mississippiensis TaxID=8496 RepID=A0A151PH47_ALLMI|nr:hypothetical protein Y1Q_0022630 [Alligator mississippiensis]
MEYIARQDRWWAEDVAHEKAQDEVEDWADWEFWVQLLALEHEWVKALQEQNTRLAQAVQVRDDDHWVLDTVLALVVTFVPPIAWLLTLALPLPWQPPTAKQ